MSYNFHQPIIRIPGTPVVQSITSPATIACEENICWRDYLRYLHSLKTTDNGSEAFADDEFDWETWELEEYNYYAGIDELGYSDADRDEEMQFMKDYFDAHPNPIVPASCGTTTAVEYSKDFRAGIRYQKTERHEERLKRNASIIFANRAKRSDEDSKNPAFCKRRGNRSVKMPKPVYRKCIDILFDLDRQNLIPDSCRDQVTEVLNSTKNIRKEINTDYGYSLAYIRKLRKNDAARFEFECQMSNLDKALAS